ncbi:hypothetical protein HNQ91_000696 [Filimonas zeae]|nr:hypothetical protein [Filimonas zeae]MDR6337674.1 hypothetical protein [Filimonas zeae]
MTKDNRLEVGDHILYQSVAGTYLVPVVTVRRKYAEIEMPMGFRLLLVRSTDGNMARLPKCEIPSIATCTVIPGITVL